MLGTDYMKFDLFIEKYQTNKGTIEVNKSRGVYPKEAFAKSGKYLYVNEHWFIERKEYQMHVRTFNQDMYYWMRDYHASDASLARELNVKTKDINVQQYFCDDMFRPIPEDINDTNIREVEQQVFDAFKRIERFIKRAYPSWDVKYILDKRMDEAG